MFKQIYLSLFISDILVFIYIMLKNIYATLYILMSLLHVSSFTTKRQQPRSLFFELVSLLNLPFLYSYYVLFNIFAVTGNQQYIFIIDYKINHIHILYI